MLRCPYKDGLLPYRRDGWKGFSSCRHIFSLSRCTAAIEAASSDLQEKPTVRRISQTPLPRLRSVVQRRALRTSISNPRCVCSATLPSCLARTMLRTRKATTRDGRPFCKSHRAFRVDDDLSDRGDPAVSPSGVEVLQVTGQTIALVINLTQAMAVGRLDRGSTGRPRCGRVWTHEVFLRPRLRGPPVGCLLSGGRRLAFSENGVLLFPRRWNLQHREVRTSVRETLKSPKEGKSCPFFVNVCCLLPSSAYFSRFALLTDFSRKQP